MNIDYLLVGGPWDGERVVLAAGTPILTVEESGPYAGVIEKDPTQHYTETIVLDSARYVNAHVSWYSGEEVLNANIMHPAGTPILDTLRRLLEGYRKPTPVEESQKP